MEYELAPNVKIIKRQNGDYLVFNPDNVKYYTLSSRSGEIVNFIKNNGKSSAKEIYTNLVKEVKADSYILSKIETFLVELHKLGIIITP